MMRHFDIFIISKLAYSTSVYKNLRSAISYNIMRGKCFALIHLYIYVFPLAGDCILLGVKLARWGGSRKRVGGDRKEIAMSAEYGIYYIWHPRLVSIQLGFFLRGNRICIDFVKAFHHSFYIDVQHVFTIVTSKRQWICQAKSKEAKVNWLSLLHNSKRTTLNRS